MVDKRRKLAAVEYDAARKAQYQTLEANGLTSGIVLEDMLDEELETRTMEFVQMLMAQNDKRKKHRAEMLE